MSDEKDKKPWFLAIALPGAGVLAVGSLVWIILSVRAPTQMPGDIPAAPAHSLVTLSKYEKIQTGMSFDAVTTLMETPGRLVSESNDTKIYNWKAKAGPQSINCVFRAGRLVGKSQVALEKPK